MLRSRAYAVIDGRDYVTPEDVKAVAYAGAPPPHHDPARAVDEQRVGHVGHRRGARRRCTHRQRGAGTAVTTAPAADGDPLAARRRPTPAHVRAVVGASAHRRGRRPAATPGRARPRHAERSRGDLVGAPPPPHGTGGPAVPRSRGAARGRGHHLARPRRRRRGRRRGHRRDRQAGARRPRPVHRCRLRADRRATCGRRPPRPQPPLGRAPDRPGGRGRLRWGVRGVPVRRAAGRGGAAHHAARAVGVRFGRADRPPPRPRRRPPLATPRRRERVQHDPPVPRRRPPPADQLATVHCATGVAARHVHVQRPGHPPGARRRRAHRHRRVRRHRRPGVQPRHEHPRRGGHRGAPPAPRRPGVTAGARRRRHRACAGGDGRCGTSAASSTRWPPPKPAPMCVAGGPAAARAPAGDARRAAVAARLTGLAVAGDHALQPRPHRRRGGHAPPRPRRGGPRATRCTRSPGGSAVLERRREIRRVQEVGVPVVEWLGPGSLDQVLRDLHRRAGAPWVVRR